ncbi:hypothetical protein AVEN_138430-1 [Araneus ventricosus]|uniref:Uncharacterized protein n=1 Tax=Araneus ventricosus TaxID=182803 RepID=A0A4Y2WUK9_ARAVE|nr:hypothetical protein AVEN_138430-1 [Araneus ventricosus]
MVLAPAKPKEHGQHIDKIDDDDEADTGFDEHPVTVRNGVDLEFRVNICFVPPKIANCLPPRDGVLGDPALMQAIELTEIIEENYTGYPGCPGSPGSPLIPIELIPPSPGSP